MGRTAAVTWHASFSVIAAGLYFFFVLPRWPELMGETSPMLGLVLRITTGVLIALAALPVFFTLQRTRRPEYGTPQLALRLRTSAVVFHVLAGLLIVGAAVSEIWLSLDAAGQWLFGIYGAAASIALLGILGFYLAFLAELPPPPPKPLKTKQKRGSHKTEADVAEDSAETEAPTDVDESEDSEVTESTAEEPEVSVIEAEPSDASTPEPITASQEDSPEDDVARQKGKLRNRRPTNKSGFSRLRRHSRDNVAVED
ncbi:hypothetical protein [Mycobacterium sp. 155]|uniref:hypothetical protein n=1 Tax=Mycobacterium sp. 155 TaxID=1157943 RepID=UPI00039D7C99|nr:hypothetical protein [Mycobacterium sp. 155]